jgi:hypothetical protein
MTAPDTTHDATLTDRLERQLATLDRLDALAERQDRLIDDGAADALLALIGERQALVDELVGLGRSIEAEVDQLAPERRTPRVDDLLDAIARRAGRIAARDEQHRRRLEARRDELASEMTGVGRGRTALAAYAGGASGRGARFQDTEA